MKKNLSAILLFSFINISFLTAESYISTQSHNGKVTSLLAVQSYENNNSSFFSSGTDGFLIHWDGNNTGEHYQISDLTIGNAVKNPLTNELAIYETDSLTMNKITILDWNSLSKKFSKRFKDSITCLAYSEKGNYIIVGTTAVNGIYILNAKTGLVNKKIKDISSIITMAKTGASEKNAVMYSPTGFLYYYDFAKDKVIAKFQTQSDLEQPTLLGTGKMQNRFFAGTRNNGIYIIDALSGKILMHCPATSPSIVTGTTEDEEGLYYICSTGRGYALKLISYKMLEECIKKKNSYGVQEGTLIKNFSGLKSRDSITAIAKNSDSILLGTAYGDIYAMSDIIESETYTLQPITEKTFQTIHDISSDSQNFYFLTENSIYTSIYGAAQPKKIASNPSHTNLLINSDSIILWSKNTRKDVIKITPDAMTGEVKTEKLFTPKAKLKTVRLSDNKILFIQGNNSVSIYNLETKEIKEIYTGTSLEDAIIINGTAYIAKSALSSTDSALIAVNMQTGETVPLKTKGSIIFSLSNNENNPNDIYGILMVRQKDDTYTTEVFAYNTNTKFLKSLISINDEDSTAFTEMNGTESLYTNIGKNQVYSFNTKTTRSVAYMRSASIPLKIAISANNNNIAILNKDGSISWYMKDSPKAISNWYLTIENSWWEF